MSNVALLNPSMAKCLPLRICKSSKKKYALWLPYHARKKKKTFMWKVPGVKVPKTTKNTFELSIREKPFKRNNCPAIKGAFICIHTSSAAYLYTPKYQPSALWTSVLSVQIGLV